MKVDDIINSTYPSRVARPTQNLPPSLIRLAHPYFKEKPYKTIEEELQHLIQEEFLLKDKQLYFQQSIQDFPF